MISTALRAAGWLSICFGALPAQSFDDLLGQAETKLRAKDPAAALPLANNRDGEVKKPLAPPRRIP